MASDKYKWDEDWEGEYTEKEDRALKPGQARKTKFQDLDPFKGKKKDKPRLPSNRDNFDEE